MDPSFVYGILRVMASQWAYLVATLSVGGPVVLVLALVVRLADERLVRRVLAVGDGQARLLQRLYRRRHTYTSAQTGE